MVVRKFFLLTDFGFSERRSLNNNAVISRIGIKAIQDFFKPSFGVNFKVHIALLQENETSGAQYFQVAI